MPTPIENFVKQFQPENTVLLFGAGASIPSGAPSVSEIILHLAKTLNEPTEGYSFSDYSSLFEMRFGRKELISRIRDLFVGLQPTGGMSNISDYKRRCIFTTNYDDLIEKCYLKKDKKMRIFSSNFDFGGASNPLETPLMKIHGTIDKDVSDGNNSRLILTIEDNELVESYH